MKLGKYLLKNEINDNVLLFRYITVDMLKKLLPMPAKKDDESLMTMVCGPPGFMRLLSGEKTKDMKQVIYFYFYKKFSCSCRNILSIS